MLNKEVTVLATLFSGTGQPSEYTRTPGDETDPGPILFPSKTRLESSGVWEQEENHGAVATHTDFFYFKHYRGPTSIFSPDLPVHDHHSP